MPKIIENLRGDILETAEGIIMSEGPDALSMRAVSKKLGIAVATIYNYFSSKEQLIGEIMSARWAELLRRIDEAAAPENELISALSAMSDEISHFMGSAFSDWMRNCDLSQITAAHTEHISEKKELVFSALEQRVAALLLAHGFAPYESAHTLTLLIIACGHSDELDFSKIAAAFKSLY